MDKEEKTWAELIIRAHLLERISQVANTRYKEKSEPSERHSCLAVRHHREIRIWYDTLREKVPQGSGVLIGGIS